MILLISLYKIFVKYVILLYAKEWFTIKNNPLCTDGTNNLFSIIKSIRDYDINVFNIVKNSLNRNSFFAHSENVLLAMLADENAVRMKMIKSIRDYDINMYNNAFRMKAVVKILQARGLQSSKILGEFNVPKLNLNCEYYDIIDKNEEWLEPPLTYDIDSEIFASYNNLNVHLFYFPHPCHSQAVDRHVKIVSEASIRGVDQLSRDCHIFTTC